MTSFFTRNGDDGTTGLLGEGRVPKYHPRMEALGAIDEATAALGLARALCTTPQTGQILLEIQQDLYHLMTEVAATPEHVARFRYIGTKRVHWLESQIEALSKNVQIPKEFILPGDTHSGAALALSRTAVRRAERQVARLAEGGEVTNPAALQYLNRLSSLCFVLELHENQRAGGGSTLAGEK